MTAINAQIIAEHVGGRLLGAPTAWCAGSLPPIAPVLTTLSWLVYTGFLTGHHLFGWRGVTGVRWNLAAFALLLLGYLGSKFVLEYLL